VELTVVRMRRPEPQTVKLTRANLTLPSVEGKMLAGQVATSTSMRFPRRR